MLTVNRRHLLVQALPSAVALLAAARTGVAAPPPGVTADVHYRMLRLNNLEIFYREAGPAGAPVLLLLHGFPTSSFMFRQLIPLLSTRFRVIAPDYPGFGQSSFPSAKEFQYTFANLASTMTNFVEALGISRHVLYIQDYGAPIGLRMALAHPERVSALVVQNGNAYEEGLSPLWDPIKAFWRDPSPKNREQLRQWLGPQGIQQQYLMNIDPAQRALFSPDTWTLDIHALSRPGNVDVQLDLFGDYQHNVALYPQFQRYFRERRPPTLIAWGTRDPFFTLAGAKAYQRDLPNAEVHLLDTGHFALETHARFIAEKMLNFLGRNLRR